MANLSGILGNGTVAGETAGRGDVQDHLARPRRLVGIQFPQPLIGPGVTGEVGQMPEVVAVLQQRIEDVRVSRPRNPSGYCLPLVSGYARKAKVELPSLGEYERQAKVPRIGL